MAVFNVDGFVFSHTDVSIEIIIDYRDYRKNTFSQFKLTEIISMRTMQVSGLIFNRTDYGGKPGPQMLGFLIAWVLIPTGIGTPILQKLEPARILALTPTQDLEHFQNPRSERWQILLVKITLYSTWPSTTADNST